MNQKPEKAFAKDLLIVGRGMTHKDGTDDYGDRDSDGYDVRCHLDADEEMVVSMMTYGVLVPVLVRPVKDAKGADRLMVLDGRQRTINSRERDMRLPPVEIKLTYEDEVKDAAEIGNVTNEHRITDSPMIKAWKVDDAITKRGLTNEQAAAEFRCTVPTIKNWRALLKLSPKCMKAVDSLKLSETLARKLVHLSEEEQDAELASLLETAKPGKQARGKKAAAEIEKKVGTRGKKRAMAARILNRVLIEAALDRLNKPGACDMIDTKKGAQTARESIAEGMRAAINWVLGKGDAAYGLDETAKPKRVKKKADKSAKESAKTKEPQADTIVSKAPKAAKAKPAPKPKKPSKSTIPVESAADKATREAKRRAQTQAQTQAAIDRALGAKKASGPDEDDLC